MAILDVCFTEPREDGCSGFGRSASFENSAAGLMQGFVRTCSRLVDTVHREIERGTRGGPVCVLGQLRRPSPQRLASLVQRLGDVSPKTSRVLASDGTIRSDLWLASDVLGPGREQAVEVIKYDANPEPMVLRAYEHSDRVVVVLSGSGLVVQDSRSLREIAGKGPQLRSERLSAGSMALVTRGFVHSFVGRDDNPMTLLVCHVPFIPPDDPRSMTVARWWAFASLRDIRDVFKDRHMLTVMYAISRGSHTTTDLCEAMHLDRDAVESLGVRLEAIRMVKRDDAGGWRLHNTVALEEKDGKIYISREELGYRVELKAPRVQP